MRQIIFSALTTLAALLVAAKLYRDFSRYGRNLFTHRWEHAKAVGGLAALRARLVPALILVCIAALLRAYSRLFANTPLIGADQIGAVLVFLVALGLFLERVPDLTAPHPDQPPD